MKPFDLSKKLITTAIFIVSILLTLSAGSSQILLAQSPSAPAQHLVKPGDTWQALGWQYGISEYDIRHANRHIHLGSEPAIGTEIDIPEMGPRSGLSGILAHRSDGGLLEFAAAHDANPWQLSILNDFRSPYTPLLDISLFIPKSEFVPRDLPSGFRSLDLASYPIRPGEAIGFRAQMNGTVPITATLAGDHFAAVSSGDRIVGLTGTGAFFPAGNHEFTIAVEGSPPWHQSLRISPGEWTYEQINLTGSAAAIDQASIEEEWERLSSVWSVITPEIRWQSAFRLPTDSFLEFSSLYGAHRSYNGGPYRSYHEGLDFSAYGGTPVLAPAAGTVVVAEFLYVRGGAVIIDHGQGVFSGLYHMSEILVQPGEYVAKGQEIGKVGSTGLSTGNHLHWDFLINGTQVDPLSWLDKTLGCWVLEGIGDTCD
jgi:murein DD-endopeptidase MepM/ murein hydrolase activator NlpD